MKPEIWQDEKVGDLSHGARLLMLGLLTMADDEGRLRALPALILGHVFPYDDVTSGKLKRWIDEIEGAGLVLSYSADTKPYIAFRRWARHQRPNRPSASSLPEPPDPQVVTDNSVNVHGKNSDNSGNGHGSITAPRVGAGSRSVPDPKEFVSWLEHYKTTTGKTRVQGSQPARDAFVARRKDGYGLKDLKLATVGCHGDDFCREHGHDVPETILQASKVTRYIELGRKSTPRSVVVDA